MEWLDVPEFRRCDRDFSGRVGGGPTPPVRTKGRRHLNRSNQFVKSKIKICFSLPSSLFSKRCLHPSGRSPRVVVTVVPRQWPLRFVVRVPLQFSKRPSTATSKLTHRQTP